MKVRLLPITVSTLTGDMKEWIDAIPIEPPVLGRQIMISPRNQTQTNNKKKTEDAYILTTASSLE